MIHIEIILNKNKVSEPVFHVPRRRCTHYSLGICKFYSDEERNIECRYVCKCIHFGIGNLRNLSAPPTKEFSGEVWQWTERFKILDWIKKNEADGLYERREQELKEQNNTPWP